MPFNTKAMSRFQTSDNGGNDQTVFYTYMTRDTLAAVIAPGYFNSHRIAAKVGDVVYALVAKGTPDARHVVLRYTAVPTTGNVTVAVDSVVNAQAPIADIALAAVTDFPGVTARLTTIQTTINALLTALRAAGVVRTS